MIEGVEGFRGRGQRGGLGSAWAGHGLYGQFRAENGG